MSRYNDFVTERLCDGALEAVAASGGDRESVAVHWVPGAFELPFAAQQLASTGRFDAVVALGCLIRGETPHFEVIASAVAQGLVDASLASGVPMTFGVLTTHSAEQALARAGSGSSNKGWEAAVTALHMARFVKTVLTGTPSEQLE